MLRPNRPHATIKILDFEVVVCVNFESIAIQSDMFDKKEEANYKLTSDTLATIEHNVF